MNPELFGLFREGLILALLLSAPTLGGALATGLITGILQGATQIHEQSLATVPRIFISLTVTLLLAPWMGNRAVRFATHCLEMIGGAH
jgi:flagellar biosynthesis protein FliQ